MILGGLIAIIAVAVSNANKNNGTPASGPSPSGPVAAFAVGQPVQVGDTGLIFTVTSVKSSKGSEFDHATRGQYLIVGVAFANNGNTPQNVSSLVSFDLRDASGQSYTETVISDAPKPPDGEIAPHDKLAGALTYDVGHSAFKLYFKNDLFSGGQVIVDLGPR